METTNISQRVAAISGAASGIGLALKAVKIRTVVGHDEANIFLGHYNHRIAARMAVTMRTAAIAMASR